MAGRQAGSTTVVDERQVAFDSVLDAFEYMYGKPIRKDIALMKVARNLFDLTLGEMDGSVWKHSRRWGTQLPGEDDKKSVPEYPPKEMDHTSGGKRKFRKHMRHLAQCMGREARQRAAAHPPLTAVVLELLIRDVMHRSKENDCRPMMPGPDCNCAPIDVLTESRPVKVLMPRVCEKI